MKAQMLTIEQIFEFFEGNVKSGSGKLLTLTEFAKFKDGIELRYLRGLTYLPLMQKELAGKIIEVEPGYGEGFFDVIDQEVSSKWAIDEWMIDYFLEDEE